MIDGRTILSALLAHPGPLFVAVVAPWDWPLLRAQLQALRGENHLAVILIATTTPRGCSARSVSAADAAEEARIWLRGRWPGDVEASPAWRLLLTSPAASA